MKTEKPALAGASLPRVSSDVRQREARRAQAYTQVEAVDRGRWEEIPTPSATATIDHAEFLVGVPNLHSRFLALARWHFEQRALSAVLQSGDEEQAFRLLHQTDYSAANRPLRDRLMNAWGEAYRSGESLAEALRALDDDEVWQVRCAEFPLHVITETETAAHKLIVQLGKELAYG